MPIMRVITEQLEDFETALSENPNHQNARKYMFETLMAQSKV